VYSGKDPVASATDSTDSKADSIEPAQRPVENVVRPGVRFIVDVHDPIESFNRRMYLFNAKFDEYVFLPVVEGYETVMPDFFEDRVSDFFSNIADIRNLMNAILQLKGETSLKIFTRFLVNSTFGLGGFFDHATPLGYPQQIEDFGQTLGHYGLNPGPYLVLPIFGPSSLRDTTGLVVDSAAQFFYLYTPLGFDDHLERSAPYTLTNATDTRHRLSFRYYQTGSPFEYDLIRLLYTKNRELEIAK
jgi:phospholipid-binding lipoprotein MlaA